MKVFSTKSEIRQALGADDKRRGSIPADGRIIGFVPTMGALHKGHLSLVEKCKAECDVTVVSIFVNPTQFNDPKDLTNYPRNTEADLEMLEKAGADIVFIPSVGEMYPSPDMRLFDFGNLDKVMEGAHRKGHFNGVAQIVTRLFDIVVCNRAYFGEKDFQQVAIIRELVEKQGYDIEIAGCPIVRESDGLAMSSRNLLLTHEHRKAAPLIYKTLSESLLHKDDLSVKEFEKNVIDKINKDPLLKVEYFEVVNARTLESIESWRDPAPKRGCIAVFAGNIRLIDNIEIL